MSFGVFFEGDVIFGLVGDGVEFFDGFEVVEFWFGVVVLVWFIGVCFDV